MKTIRIKIYKFSELSKEAQQEALNIFRTKDARFATDERDENIIAYIMDGNYNFKADGTLFY